MRARGGMLVLAQEVYQRQKAFSLYDSNAKISRMDHYRSKTRFESFLSSKRDPDYLLGLRPIFLTQEDTWNPWYRELWDCERGIAYRGEHGPVYYTGNGIETTDDVPRQ